MDLKALREIDYSDIPIGYKVIILGLIDYATELEKVVGQRNAECDRLIIEKGMMRINAVPQPDNYRARATQAEQKNARLIEQLTKRPNYEWFVELIRSHLGQSPETPPQHLGVQVKQLKQSRGQKTIKLPKPEYDVYCKSVLHATKITMYLNAQGYEVEYEK